MSSEVKTFDELPEEVRTWKSYTRIEDKVLSAYNAGVRAGREGDAKVDLSDAKYWLKDAEMHRSNYFESSMWTCVHRLIEALAKETK